LPDQQVKIKKVKPYPIAAQLSRLTGAASAPAAAPSSGASAGGAAPAGTGLAGQIKLLTINGFLCELPITGLQPGEKFQVTFELPVTHKQVSESIVVVKLYIQGTGIATSATGAATAGHIAEFHFTDLSLAGREAIGTFLRQLGKVQHR
jgi:hypothetical protein